MVPLSGIRVGTSAVPLDSAPGLALVLSANTGDMAAGDVPWFKVESETAGLLLRRMLALGSMVGSAWLCGAAACLVTGVTTSAVASSRSFYIVVWRWAGLWVGAISDKRLE